MIGTATSDFDVCQIYLNYLTTVNQPQTQLGGVAVPTENASRLIADVQLDNGFPLEIGVATPKVAI